MIPKFRAYLKKEKQMCAVNLIDYYHNVCWLNKDIDTRTIRRKFDNIELMQSTCMFDKNNMEIFDGDIVEQDMLLLTPKGTINYIIGEVTFLEGKWTIVDSKNKQAVFLWREGVENKILGNKYMKVKSE